LNGSIAVGESCEGKRVRQRREAIRTDGGFAVERGICVRRTGIRVSRFSDMISGDSMTMTYSVLMAFARRVGEGRERD
jgi:hypothetical protein